MFPMTHGRAVEVSVYASFSLVCVAFLTKSERAVEANKGWHAAGTWA